MPLASGQPIVLQEVWRDRVWAARPMRVVRDDGDFVALWFPKGTRWKAPTNDVARPWKLDRGSRLAECAADRVRQEGLRVAGRAEQNEPPFNEPRPEWQPDPSWDIPALPKGWHRRCR